MLEDL